MSNTHRSETVGQLVLVDLDPTRQQVKRAIAGFLAGYSGATLEAYRLDLRQWVGWLDTARLGVFVVERAHIELYARWCESEGKAPATIGRRLSTICGFYNYCSQERLVDRNPAAHVRRPKQNYESSTLGLDRNELGGFLVQAGLSGGRDHALACLLALNGLRISEALGADIDDLDVNRGHPSPFETSKRQPRTPIRERRCATTEDEDRSTATPPTSSPPSSLAPAADHIDRVAGPRAPGPATRSDSAGSFAVPLTLCGANIEHCAGVGL